MLHPLHRPRAPFRWRLATLLALTLSLLTTAVALASANDRRARRGGPTVPQRAAGSNEGVWVDGQWSGARDRYVWVSGRFR